MDALLALTLSRPREALAKARAILAGRPAPYEASVAHQAAGIVLREFGDVSAGIHELRSAVRLARRAGLIDREADVLASLGVALVWAGRTRAGLAAFDRALQLSSRLHNFPRAGFGPPVTVVPGIDTVDVSGVDLTLLGHGYFAEARPCLADINSRCVGPGHP